MAALTPFTGLLCAMFRVANIAGIDFGMTLLVDGYPSPKASCITKNQRAFPMHAGFFRVLINVPAARVGAALVMRITWCRTGW